MKNEKIMDAVRTLRQMCAEQTDCAHCPFGRDNGTCKITGIPQSWDSDFGDDHSVDTNKKVEDHSANAGKKGRNRWTEIGKAVDSIFSTPTDTPTATDTPTDTPTTRAEILDAAKKIVTGEREKQYGSPEDNFNVIAQFWSTYAGHSFTPVDVAVMMTLLKVARIKTGHYKIDSYIDACGYLACAAEIAEELI